MSLHEEISNAIGEIVGDIVMDVSPSLVALKVYQRYGGTTDEPHVQYAAVEHFKAMARKVLGDRYDPDGEQNNAHQGDMFSGLLQLRYPIRRARGDEPVYRPREALSQDDLDWNIAQLLKAAAARVEHANALQAYRDQRFLAQAA